MSAGITVRAYVVGFGDCILLRLPDGNATRHVLIDFGRAPNDPGSVGRFPDIARDIEKQCDGHLDLVVVTHEHLDHMEGFYREREVFDRMDVDRVWMSLPSSPTYYHDYPNARLQKIVRDNLAEFAGNAARKGIAFHPAFLSLLQNNLANKQRMDYVRKLGAQPPLYLARGTKGKAAEKWSKHIHVRVLAPEADTSKYYGRTAKSRALIGALRLTAAGDRQAASAGDPWEFATVPRAADDDLPGLTASDFARLRRAIREDGVAAARFIDRAQNNTSLALLVECAGKRLLLPGDAEIESWRMIEEHAPDAIAPVDFLKVAHHGSHNGTPMHLLDKLLPKARKAKAKVLVSTKRNVYGTQNPVPDRSTLDELRTRCSELTTTDGVKALAVDVKL
ncbi:hypothetical protein LYSHEL_00180 [Lysobacter helvus]|uniref:Metallo-beta-lactamase domain-containing protein n=2 Tax=Lysobacteraceae TaxID=32033 RepID=A0ABN6FNA8_9GAMM|nr:MULTISPECIES: hypothetical protein [Lysobacter]BCT90994.1 hypothetical protein LYSCAS_00180 [Lysobacter caseinilyticus]BCT94147.1 hypothetical protein LYSHEL_00180 [Lysobacter helvus]